eukprot:1159162-Pelagomonas_calceolata.AAC.1
MQHAAQGPSQPPHRPAAAGAAEHAACGGRDAPLGTLHAARRVLAPHGTGLCVCARMHRCSAR